MMSVAHLMDDTAVGGVSRGLMDRISKISANFDCRQVIVEPLRSISPPERKDIAVVHFTVSWAKLAFMVMLRAQYAGGPIVIVEHSYTRAFEQLYVRNLKRFRAMLRLNYKLADVVVAVSNGQAEWLLEAGVVPAEKLVVIRSATDCSGLYHIAPPPERSGPLRLAAYGRYNEQKAFDVLIDAMRSVSPSIAHLTIAGYGPLERQLRAQAASVPNVTIQGKIDGDLADFLASCDVVVVPSRFEAFGIVGVEARAAARPIIAADLDGLSEQVSASYGLLVRPEDPLALAVAIEKMSKMDLLPMGIAARISVVNHFDRNLHSWIELLKQLQPRTK